MCIRRLKSKFHWSLSPLFLQSHLCIAVRDHFIHFILLTSTSCFLGSNQNPAALQLKIACPYLSLYSIKISFFILPHLTLLLLVYLKCGQMNFITVMYYCKRTFEMAYPSSNQKQTKPFPFSLYHTANFFATQNDFLHGHL